MKFCLSSDGMWVVNDIDYCVGNETLGSVKGAEFIIN